VKLPMNIKSAFLTPYSNNMFVVAPSYT